MACAPRPLTARRVSGGALMTLALLGLVVPAVRGAEPPRRPLVVGIADMPPFAIREGDGSWTGLGLELWREIAAQLELSWTAREIAPTDVSALLRDGSIDLALGAVPVTAAGAVEHDFSQPYYTTGVGFAERSRGAVSWRAAADEILTSDLLRVVVVILAAIVLVGVLMTLIERRANAAHFGGSIGRGLATGMWWAAVTMTTVGYGDTTPRTISGRSLAVIWMFIGVAAVAIFTATVTSILTVGSLQATVRPSELLTLRLAAVAGGPGAEYLARHQVQFSTYNSPGEALGDLAAGKVQAVVAPIPVLRYSIARERQGQVRVSPYVLERIGYAIGLPDASPLREPIDRALLAIVEGDRWRDVEARYLGDQ